LADSGLRSFKKTNPGFRTGVPGTEGSRDEKAWEYYFLGSTTSLRVPCIHPEVRLVKRKVATVNADNIDDDIALDEALHALEALDSQQARIVELRFYVDLSVEETAEVLGIGSATVKRDWAMARAWLLRELATKRRPAAPVAR
jgi:RNA polymerase sigma factor (sigma-70 family)